MCGQVLLSVLCLQGGRVDVHAWGGRANLQIHVLTCMADSKVARWAYRNSPPERSGHISHCSHPRWLHRRQRWSCTWCYCTREDRRRPDTVQTRPEPQLPSNGQMGDTNTIPCTGPNTTATTASTYMSFVAPSHRLFIPSHTVFHGLIMPDRKPATATRSTAPCPRQPAATALRGHVRRNPHSTRNATLFSAAHSNMSKE